MFWFFHALMCPVSVSCVLPSVCRFSQPCIPLVISPVGPPHLFLVLSSVSVYLVSVFPSLPVWSLYVCLCQPLLMSLLPFMCLLLSVPYSPTVCVFGFEFCILHF